MKYISIDDKTNVIFNETETYPDNKYLATHKEVFPHGVTRIWYDRSDNK